MKKYLLAILSVMALMGAVAAQSYEVEVSQLAEELKPHLLENTAFKNLVEKEIAQLITDSKDEVSFEEMTESIFEKYNNDVNAIQENLEKIVKEEIEPYISSLRNNMALGIDEFVKNEGKIQMLTLIKGSIRRRFPLPDEKTSLDSYTDYQEIRKKIIHEEIQEKDENGEKVTVYIHEYDLGEIDILAEEIYEEIEADIVQVVEEIRDSQLSLLQLDIEAELTGTVQREFPWLEIEQKLAALDGNVNELLEWKKSTEEEMEKTKKSQSFIGLLLIILLIFSIIFLILLFLRTQGSRLRSFVKRDIEDMKNEITKDVSQRARSSFKLILDNELVDIDGLKERTSQIETLAEDITTRTRNIEENLSSVQEHHRPVVESVLRLESSLGAQEGRIRNLEEKEPQLRNLVNSAHGKYDDIKQNNSELQKKVEKILSDVSSIEKNFRDLKERDYSLLLLEKRDIEEATDLAQGLTDILEKGVMVKEPELLYSYTRLLHEKYMVFRTLNNRIEESRTIRNPLIQEYWFGLIRYLDSVEHTEYGGIDSVGGGKGARLVKIWLKGVVDLAHGLLSMFDDPDCLFSMKALRDHLGQLPPPEEYYQIWQRARIMSWDEANRIVDSVLSFKENQDYRLIGFPRRLAEALEEVATPLPVNEDEKQVMRKFLTVCALAFEDMWRRYQDAIDVMRRASLSR